jgi:O-antigen ligase
MIHPHPAAGSSRRRPAILRNSPHDGASETASEGAWLDRALRLTLYATIIAALTLIQVRGHDAFLLPKVLAIRAGAIIMAAIITASLLYAQARSTWCAILRDRFSAVIVAIAAWSILTAAAATNRAVAGNALLSAAALGVLFVAAYRVARYDRPLTFIAVALIPCLANATVLLLQVTNVWNPFAVHAAGADRASFTALVGNADYAGDVLLPSSAVALALVLVTRNVFSITAALVIVCATIASLTITSIALLPIVLGTMMVLATRRYVPVLAIITTVCCASLLYAPTRHRFQHAFEHATARQFNASLSYRLIAFGAAWEMIRDHPLLGVGPGNFAYDYYDYKILAAIRYPSLLATGEMSRVMNFGDAHSDHLQIAAETGLPGYVLFLFALAYVARVSLRNRRGDHPGEVARLMALPLAAALFFSALVHFPLQLPASSALYTYMAAACLAWSRE